MHTKKIMVWIIYICSDINKCVIIITIMCVFSNDVLIGLSIINMWTAFL